jgi:hypothetical protein
VPTVTVLQENISQPDVCGNSSSQTQTITVNDQTAPVINSIPSNTTVSCVGDVPSANDAAVSASDNCGGAVTITHNADVITPGSCANRYSIARTYIATDVCGNSSSQTQTITVNDQTAPVINSIPSNTTVSCVGDVPAANDAAYRPVTIAVVQLPSRIMQMCDTGQLCQPLQYCKNIYSN